jgi:hypothetical protein
MITFGKSDVSAFPAVFSWLCILWRGLWVCGWECSISLTARLSAAAVLMRRLSVLECKCVEVHVFKYLLSDCSCPRALATENNYSYTSLEYQNPIQSSHLIRGALVPTWNSSMYKPALDNTKFALLFTSSHVRALASSSRVILSSVIHSTTTLANEIRWIIVRLSITSSLIM